MRSIGPIVWDRNKCYERSWWREISCIKWKRGKITWMVISYVRTALWNTWWKERQKGTEGKEEDTSRFGLPRGKENVLEFEKGISRPVFLNRRAAERYRAVASIIPGRERLSWNLSFKFSKQFSWINVLKWKYSEEKNINECVKNSDPDVGLRKLQYATRFH